MEIQYVTPIQHVFKHCGVHIINKYIIHTSDPKQS